MNTYQTHLEQVIQFFETLTPASTERLAEVYTEDALFKDPFNSIQGLPAIRHLFEHMFEQILEPHFVVLEHVLEKDTAFITWDFTFRIKHLASEKKTIHGATKLKFAADGRVCLHRDYWDAAEELYEKLPVVKYFMRGLKSVANM